ncbi:MAG: SpoIIE family protein phosphatase [Actinomycetota bacterium]|nr:SpoIIE family protein phosphatase [Actinomycetota bacterium]
MTRTGARSIRALFRRREDPYAGAELDTSRKIVGLIWALCSALTLALLPLDPPTHALGAAGWAPAILIVAGGLVGVRLLLDERRAVTFDGLLAVSYLGLLQTALLVFLAGEHSGYRELFVLWVGSGVGVHPPQRGLRFLGAALVASWLPLLYEGYSAHAAADLAAHSLLWCAVGLAVVVLVAATRAQRIALRAGERTARAEAEVAAKRVATLHHIAEVALTHKPLDDLLHELLDLVGDALETEWGAVLLREADDSRLTLRAVRGGPAPVPATRIRPGEWLAGRVAIRRKPLVMADVHEQELNSPLLAGQRVCSLVAVPLIARGSLIGVLQAGSLTQRRFDDDDVRLLLMAAERMALAIDRARMFEDTRRIAETLQRKLLPETLPTIPGVDMAARYLPGGPGVEVGGDWYDVFVYKDGRVGLAMGDVVGHGIDAASLMGQLRTALRAYALEERSPAIVLDRLSALFHQLAPTEMATLVFVVFEPGTARVRLASAGHPPPLAVAPDGSSFFLEHETCPPLGVMPYLTYRERVARLEPGSTLLLYTDGLVEQRGSIETGLHRLRQAVAGEAPDPEALCDRVTRALLPDGSGGDDAAMLALRDVPVDARHLSLRLPADPEALVLARRTLASWLEAAQATKRETYELSVAAGEACSNAIEHAYPPGQADFVLDAERTNGDVEITVSDAGRWRQGRGDERGRGLDLMRALTDEVDVRATAAGTEVRLRRRLGAPV